MDPIEVEFQYYNTVTKGDVSMDTVYVWFRGKRHASPGPKPGGRPYDTASQGGTQRLKHQCVLIVGGYHPHGHDSRQHMEDE